MSRKNIALFFVLFALLVFRTPEDLFTPYLWAEDGTVLIQGSIFDGLKGVVKPGNGAYWIIQKILALLCYWLVLPFGSIALLPYIMQVLSKILATLAIMYFVSNEFEWLVKEKLSRFWICIAIILLMPQNASDVLTCDTSLPFALFFGAFLIGLNLLCREEVMMPNVKQTLFLAILALSSAGAPFIAAIVGLPALRWLIDKIKTKTLNKRAFFIEATKLAIVLTAVFVQMKLLFSSGRASSDLELVRRVILNTKNFIFFPYWQQFHSWVAFFAGAIIWIILWRLTKISWKVLLYGGLFSWLFMFYCSMTTTADAFYTGSMTGRYVFICFEISALMLGLAITYFLRSKDVTGYIGDAMVCGIVIVSLMTYNVETIGADLAYMYENYSNAYKVGGEDNVRIPIGPYSPWILTIPANMSEKSFTNDLEIGFEYINGILIGSENWGLIDRNLNAWGSVKISGWAKVVNNTAFKQIFLKNGTTYTAGMLTTREWFHEKRLTHYGFNFDVMPDYISEGMTTFEFLVETEDGLWHQCTIELATTFIN